MLVALGLVLANLSGTAPDVQVRAMCLPRNRLQPGQVPIAQLEQPTWRTLAGYPSLFGAGDGALWTAQFGGLIGVAADSSNTLYIADSGNNTIRKIGPEGTVATWAGVSGVSGFRDGPNGTALFGSITALAVDQNGNVFVGDGYRIRQITAGVVSTLAGGQTGYQDGSGTNAAFGGIMGLAVAGDGSLYVADGGTNNVIRKVTSTGVVTTFAGAPNPGNYQDGVGTNAWFNVPMGVACDSSGIVYVVDSGNQVIRKILADGTVTTFAGQASAGNWLDGTGTNAMFNGPMGVAIAEDSTLYVADNGNACIRKITPSGEVTTIAGNPGLHDHADGPAAVVRFSQPIAIAISQGQLAVADQGDNTIRIGGLAAQPHIDILSHPINVIVPEGSNAVFQINSQSAKQVKYQWFSGDGYFDGTDQSFPNGTNAELVLSNADQWAYSVFRVAVADEAGYQLSGPVTVQVVTPPVAGPGPLAQWDPVASQWSGTTSAAAYGNGRFVAVGGDGSTASILDSTDGMQWNKQWPRQWPQEWNQPWNGTPGLPLNGVAFGNGLFVAVGTNGLILTSPDGLTWANHSLSSASPSLQSVAFGQGLFVAGSSDVNGSLWVSSGGVFWTNIGFEFGRHFQKVFAGGGKFIALGNTILVSTNGVNWDPAPIPDTSLGDYAVFDSIAYGNGMYLAAKVRTFRPELGYSCGTPGVFASSDGIGWVEVTPTNGLTLSQVCFGNGGFAAFDQSSGGVTFSTDGINWSLPVTVDTNQTPSNPTLTSVEDQFILAENTFWGEAPLFTSPDAVSWTGANQNRAIPWQPSFLIHVNEEYIGTGFIRSSNLTDWGVLPSVYGYNSIAYGSGVIVAVGSSDAVAVSSNGGANWYERLLPFTPANSVVTLNDVTFGDNRFVAVGIVFPTTSGAFTPYPQIWTSADGTTWQFQATSPNVGGGLFKVAFGNGSYVAVVGSSPGAILSSTNGTDWQKTWVLNPLSSVCFGNGHFVASGPSTVLTSIDGQSWIQHSGINNPGSCIFGNGVFIGCNGNMVYTSTDGIVWNAQSTDVSVLFSLYAGEGVFLAWGQDAYGNQGLFESAPIEQLNGPTLLPGGQFQWTVTGARNLIYDIQASADFGNWQLIRTVSNSAPTEVFTDLGAANYPRRFYRVVGHPAGN